MVTPLLRWGEANLADRPWRRSRDPWEILVAETMLQQTQVGRVVERWQPFLDQFPDPTICAAAPAGAMVKAWKGLGYNRRALALHGAATLIVDRHDGSVPRDLDALLALPGVGPYTARAVRAFAFEETAAVVDTNVGRVLARLVGRSLGARDAQELADSLAPVDRPWMWNQAIMEFGATVCTKRAPTCATCVLAESCAWRGRGADPAVGSAGVGGPQPRFEGSDRQMRGRLVDALRGGPVPVDEVGFVVDCADRRRVEAVVRSLVDDGLAVLDGRCLTLP